MMEWICPQCSYHVTFDEVRERGTTRILRLRIREVAEQQGIDQRELAERVGVHRQTIRRYWSHQSLRIRTSMLMKLAAALKVSVRDLIEEVPDDAEGR